MVNIALILKYVGTAYHGWQSQKNATAISDVVSAAIKKVTGNAPHPRLEGCGRTDAGVHAEVYAANFHTESQIPPARLPYALNQQLPSDIKVMHARQVEDEFHARFSCLRKEYVYRIHPSRFPNPFYSDRALLYPCEVHPEKMCRAAADLVGRHDFRAFCATGSHVKNTVRELYACEVRQQGELLEIAVCADGFLYNMVRIIAGTLLYVSAGKIPEDAMPQILREGRRVEAGVTLPPHGLYLHRLWYDEKYGLYTH